MNTYDDIQTIDRITQEEFESGGASLAGAFDVKASELDTEDWELWKASAYNEQPMHILWFVDAMRAGIIHGGDPVWTDATSVQDAIERYFGDEDKELVN